MIKLNIQLSILIFSYIYGLLFYYLLYLCRRYIDYHQPFFKIINTITFLFLMTLIYLVGLEIVCDGILHIYSIIVIIFSALTPVGALIGVFIMEMAGESDVSNLIQGILITLASGTFLYVAVIEIFAEQFENGKHKYLKFILALILFFMMSFVTFFEG